MNFPEYMQILELCSLQIAKVTFEYWEFTIPVLEISMVFFQDRSLPLNSKGGGSQHDWYANGLIHSQYILLI